MRAAVILGLGCHPKHLRPFQENKTQLSQKIEWQMGLPGSSDSVDVILLFGGDGTIHRHLGPLVQLGLPVLVVPAGSGNDFARALGVLRMRDSLAAWRKFCAGAGDVRTIDLGVISQIDAGSIGSADLSGHTRTSRAKDAPEIGYRRYFCCVAGVGLDGEVSRRANQLPRWLRGHGGYLLTLIPTIFRFTPTAMKIYNGCDEPQRAVNDNGTKWTTASDQPTYLAAFANTPTYGGGMKIAPQAKIDDGLLDICVVGAMDPFRLFCMFPTVYAGRHLKIREVRYSQTSRVRVETESPLDVYADGEFVCQTPVEVGIEPAALKVIGL
jgi:diacylglycerol kinase (ATP)